MLEENGVLESQENTCKEEKEAGTRGHFGRMETIQLILCRLMKCIRGRIKMLNSVDEIAVCRQAVEKVIQKS